MVDFYTYNNYEKEFRLANKVGAILSTTESFCNTKRSHGLFACKMNDLDKKYHLLLSAIDETLIQNNCSYQLGHHRFPETTYPNGIEHICQAVASQSPYTVYCMGPIKFRKQLVLVENENRLIIRYTLLESNITTKLQLQPFLAYRSIASLCKSNITLRNNYESTGNGIIFTPYNFYPSLFVQFSKRIRFDSKPDWYYNFEYNSDTESNGLVYEDLFVPGYFELYLDEGQSVYVSIGLSEIKTNTLEDLFVSESKKHMKRVKELIEH